MWTKARLCNPSASDTLKTFTGGPKFLLPSAASNMIHGVKLLNNIAIIGPTEAQVIVGNSNAEASEVRRSLPTGQRGFATSHR